jgi:serine/threonine protein kinase
VYDVGIGSDGVPYLVTEPIRGETLTDIIARQGALQPEDACDVALQLLGGLQAAHEASLVHGDLTAESVLVQSGRDGELIVKILDFGVAVPFESPSDAPMSSSRVQDLDPLDDLQAVGTMLFEMLTGRAGALEPMRAQEGGGPSEAMHARALVPAIPAGLARIVDLALSPRARRLGSANEMAELLAPFAVQDRTRALAPRNTLTPFMSPEARRTRGMARLERAVLGLSEGREKERGSVRPNLVLLDRSGERASERPVRGPAKSGASSPPRLAPHELVEPRIPKAPRAPKHFMSHQPRHTKTGQQRIKPRKYPSLPLRKWRSAPQPSMAAAAKQLSVDPRSIMGLRWWSAGLLAMAGLSAGLLLARLLHF